MPHPPPYDEGGYAREEKQDGTRFRHLTDDSCRAASLLMEEIQRWGRRGTLALEWQGHGYPVLSGGLLLSVGRCNRH